MKTLYNIGEIKPITQVEFTEIEQLVAFPLPVDYKAFLTEYGYGDINELLMITEPDEEYIRANFEEYMDLWDWEGDDEQKSLNGLTIATTIDGDVVAVIDTKSMPVIILPRDGAEPLHFSAFGDVIDYYNTTYKFKDDLYFDTDSNKKTKHIPLHKDQRKDDPLMKKLHKDFLAAYTADKTFNKGKQPKYILQSIGGWVYFDLLNGDAIRIKYQDQFKSQAKKMIAFITDYLKKNGS